MSLLYPGFADPVLDSQACFRAVLDAMARPGTIHAVAAPLEPPPPLDRATAAALLTLADGETPLWLDPAAAAAGEWVAFHCGAPAASLEQAAFALALGAVALERMQAGSDEAPELGATVILQVAGLGSGAALQLEGPGLSGPATLLVEGLPAGFVTAWAANRGRFPRGVDMVLCAGDRLAALPRTVRIEAAGEEG